jgi:endonuclease/exonuclease/phosphatase family metal-dependent hydrolase
MNILRLVGLWLWLGAASSFAIMPPKVVIPPHEGGNVTANHETSTSIGCWNMAWFPVRNPRNSDEHFTQLQIDSVHKILAEQNPAIFFACEVRSLADLKKLQLNYPFLACTNFPQSANDGKKLPNQGLAILSRHPWKEIWALDFSGLPDAPNRPSRGILGAAFTLPNRQTLTIYAVHLKSNFGNPAANRAKRESAIDYLEWDWQRRRLNPNRDHLIILGDFNSSLHDPVFVREQTLRRLLKLGFTDAADGFTPDQNITIPASNEGYPDNDFDHILVSKSLRSRLAPPPPWVKIIRVPLTVSDHYPLFIDASAWFTP